MATVPTSRGLESNEKYKQIATAEGGEYMTER